jgi:vanillate O-demethylase monooxygenase subunit
MLRSTANGVTSALASLPREFSFDPDDWQILAAHRYPIGRSRDVVHAPVSARLLDEALVVYRVSR